MSAINIGAMVRNTTSTTKIEKLSLTDEGLVLQFEKKKISKIYFSELDKIYIKVYKLKPIYGFLFFLFSLLFAFLCFEDVKLNIETTVAILPVIPALVKINRFKRYGLVIVLKDGRVFKKQVAKKLKSDTVELINLVKRKCLEH